MHIIIINAAAGSGKAVKIFKSIQKDPSFKEKQCRSFLTEYRGHAEKIAAQVAEIYHEKIDSVMVIGGDGTLHEVMNGLNKYPGIPVAFLPAGSGNDFARGIGTKLRALSLFQSIIKSPKKKLFHPGIYQVNASKKAQRYFMNSLGFGIDAAVVRAAEQARYKYILGKLGIGSLRYALVFMQVLRSFVPMEVELEIDGRVLRYNRAFMVTVANHPYYGGGMKVAPHANASSRELGVIVVQDIPKWKTLLMFLTVYTGKHVWMKEVHQYKGNNITIRSNRPMLFQVDGETGKCQSCEMKKSHVKRPVLHA
ncbi:diacylglycerol/lipid kinase family protein [Thalassobacillus pellis]|uniref:diacylglycerol/lipid kinase family protein n=1 Tax=Thalassobacillus pellis TaxID=748008 RepID=UPI001961D3E3|nr:diacylglycerol kinase family protein [Thalassobacillus pellis]MBM7554914.1 YegS/Rv2252/BmrU family lipid kinase [Thalassobacillus pellis]